MPDSVKTIGSLAFYDNKITSMTVPSGVESIGTQAFGAQSATMTIDQIETMNPLFANSMQLTSQNGGITESSGVVTPVSNTIRMTSNVGSLSFNYIFNSTTGQSVRFTGTLQIASMVSDFTPPTIILPTPADVTVSYGTNFDELAGVSAADNVDGSIALTMANVSRDITATTAPGLYEITYTVQDTTGNVATATRTITVEDSTGPTITFIDGSDWGYSVTINKGDSFDLRAQIQSVIDNVDGVMDIGSVEITSTPSFGSSQFGDYRVSYKAVDARGNVTKLTGFITVPGVSLDAVTTSNPTPTLAIMEGGLSAYNLGAYIVPADTAFDPANPGGEPIRHVISYQPGRLNIVTSLDEAQAIYRDVYIINAAQNEQGLMWEYGYGGAPIPEATPEAMKASCSDSRVWSWWLSATDEASCIANVDTKLSQYVEARLRNFNTTTAPSYDWTPLADGVYDVYFYDPYAPVNVRFPSSLTIDTTPPIQSRIITPATGNTSGGDTQVTIKSSTSPSCINLTEATSASGFPTEYDGYDLRDTAAFTLGCKVSDVSGYTTTMQITLGKHYPDTSVLKIFKAVNPRGSTRNLIDITDRITFGTTTFQGETRTTITYDVTDGGELDADGTANGIIVDPVAVYERVDATGLAATGFDIRLMLAAAGVLLLGGLTAVIFAFRKKRA